MRTINQTGQFKRDLKREAKGMHRAMLAKEFTHIVKSLALDEPLPEKLKIVCESLGKNTRYEMNGNQITIFSNGCN